MQHTDQATLEMLSLCYHFRMVWKACLVPFSLFHSSSAVFTPEMLVLKIYATFWNWNKFQKYMYNMISHKADNNVLCVCVCVYIHIIGVCCRGPSYHVHIILYKSPQFCWSFWSPWFWQWKAVGYCRVFASVLQHFELAALLWWRGANS